MTRPLFLLSFWVGVVQGCVSPISVEKAECPCTDGFVCCSVVDYCIEDIADCPEVCGDGKLTSPEECDDADANANDAACTVECEEAYCGDGYIHAGVEACDDAKESAACNPDCSETRCGDDWINTVAGEICDDGNSVDGDYCDATCTEVTGECGDGVQQTNEACDDGNGAVESCPYGSETCLVCGPDCEQVTGSTSYCGDSVVDAGQEECDDGQSSESCNSDCTLSLCGDGMWNAAAGEACDDGNSNLQDACLNNCSPASCGDGVVRADLPENDPNYEWCDTGGTSATCYADCTVAYCGDGIVSNESCDDGNSNNNDTCTNSCQFAACGDGFVGPNEVCDDGYKDACGSCNADCSALGLGIASCGDGEICQETEECDDGNRLPSDGCTGSCAAGHTSFVSAGYNHSCGRDIDGNVQCRGGGTEEIFGQGALLKGIFASGNGFICWADNSGASIGCAGENSDGQASPPVLSSPDLTAIAAGGAHACVTGTVDSENRTICWGRNEYGETSSPEHLRFIDISAGEYHTCGIDEAGGIHCWGAGGPGDATNSAPHFGQSAPPSEGIFGRIAAGERHSCAISIDGVLHCWGEVEVPTEYSDGLTVIDVSIGTDTTCVITTNLTIDCWGNPLIVENTPTLLFNSDPFFQVSVGENHACGTGIGAANMFWLDCWGEGTAAGLVGGIPW